MRAKRPTLVITFPTTTAALSWERHCMEKNIPGWLIPVPVTITADCGLAWGHAAGGARAAVRAGGTALFCAF